MLGGLAEGPAGSFCACTTPCSIQFCLVVNFNKQDIACGRGTLQSSECYLYTRGCKLREWIQSESGLEVTELMRGIWIGKLLIDSVMNV